MKTRHINVLMIDDHPLILEEYLDIIKRFESQSRAYRFNITRAHSIVEAINSLNEIFTKKKLHLVLLDIGLPKTSKYLSGLDLGTAIRKKYPDSRIIVITSYNHYPLIEKIFALIKPEGILLKSELSPNGLKAALTDVLQNIPHYTKTVLHYLTHIEKKPMLLDHYDILILYYLSEGTMTKDLVKHLPLSLSSIERRKNKLRDMLNLDKQCNDIQLLNSAKEAGYL